jgi:leucine dehydrogenase
MLTIHELNIEGYEKVIEAFDPECNLDCLVAIHNTELGPALGGVRIKTYESRDEALNDVLRLAKAMTFKSAVARNGLGGGKSVIIADQVDKTDALLRAFGEVINSLKGTYIVAEDVGSSTRDMETIRTVTPYVTALVNEKSSGDPSRFTAWGVFKGIQATAKALWGSTDLRKKVIAIQGLGNVGSKLANILFWEGVNLILTDVDTHKAHEHAVLYGADIIETNDFYSVQCDILSPCALGGGISPEHIEKMQCQAIAGAANNQLLDDSCSQLLMQKGILYAPDYIINAGGIMNVSEELSSGGYHPRAALERVNSIFDILLGLFALSKQENKSTNELANELALYNLQNGIGKRLQPIEFQ